MNWVGEHVGRAGGCEGLCVGHIKLEIIWNETKKSLHLLSSSYVSGTGQSILQILSHFILTTALLPSPF